MTKCHILLLVALLLTVSCRNKPQGPSLSEYGSHSQATQEALFEQYVEEIRALPTREALIRQDSLLREAGRDSAEWTRVTALEEKYFLDPNSPYRNEELYIPVAREILASPYSTDVQRRRAEWLMPRLHLNRPGQPAADFPFLTPKGRRTSFYAVLAEHKPEQTLLFFSNPGCPNCLEITKALQADPKVQARIASGKLLVVNIYPDEDVVAWLDYLPNYPKEWVCGQDGDQVINTDTLYWVRAIPSLYLLDAKGRVVLKDATLEDVLFNCK